MSFTFIDFFAGIGGFRQALENIKGKCVFSCEIDSKCEETYLENFGEKFNHHDISTLSEKEVPYADIICAGFPCQPFSMAGTQTGFNDSRSSVFFDLVRIASEIQPKVLFIENVPNLVKHDKGNTFNRILNSISEIGYDVSFDVLDSKFFGIPQSRKRVYLVAFRKDLKINTFEFPSPFEKTKTIRDILIEGDNTIPISKKWHNYIDLYTKKIDISDLDFDIPKTRVSLERIDKDADLNDCVFQIRSSGIRALSIHKPFPTLAVSVSGGGAMIPVLSSEKRHLSLREISRIMGYEDTFKFPVARTHAIKQLSNSVCPPVIESIGKSIIKKINQY